MPKPLPDDTWNNLFYPPPDYNYFENCADFSFEPSAPGFSWKNAWWLAEMSLLAYVKDQEKAVNPALRKAEIDTAAQIGRNHSISTKGFMAFRSGVAPFAVVAFRGTDRDDTRNALSDMRAWPKASPSKDYVLHQGFSDAFDEVWEPEIEPWLADFRAQHAQAPVFFTGHSLGAALAAVASARWKRGNSALYTFGCPRVGDERFTALVLSRGPAFRFVNSQDIVTQIPLELMGKAYFRHVGTEKYIDRHGQIHDEFSTAEKWRDVLSGIAEHGRQSAFTALRSLADPEKLCEQMRSLLPLALKGIPLGVPPFLVGNHSPARYPIHIWNHYSGQ